MSETNPMTDTWRAIEREARTHALAVLDLEKHTPLVVGNHIAWSTTGYRGVSDGFSPVHRVGAPIGNKPHTTCHEAIPDPIRRMILSSALVSSMEPCRFCEAEFARLARPHAA